MASGAQAGRVARESLEAIDRAMSAAHYTHADAREAHCWFDADRVPNDPATTAWKRLARWRQARWRDAHGFPIGCRPYEGGLRSAPVGSRLELAFARKSGANFLTPQALAAVRSRLALGDEQQLRDPDRLWANLLASMPLCFNLFGTLAGDARAAGRAVQALWPDLSATSASVRFEHSPGPRDLSFLGTPIALDVAFELDGAVGGGIVGLGVKYHEHAAVEAPMSTAVLSRCIAVAERSDVFLPGWQKALIGTTLQPIWQSHLLVLSMLQHASQHWQRGRFVLIYAALNPSFALAAAQYAEQLRDATTFGALTIEALLRTPGALDRSTRDDLQARYI